MSGPDDVTDEPGTSGSADAPDAPYTLQHDWDAATPLHLTVVSGVAVVTNTEPEALPPLYDAVDPDSLERLLRSVPDESRSAVSVAFPFAGWNVEVDATGEVTLTH